VADGNSLFVLVAPTGLRAWRWRYYFAGREKVLPLGSYPEVSLSQARAARDEARRKVLGGIDPAGERRDAKFALATAHNNSFESVARAWHKVWSVERHARYAEDVIARLERNVFPVIGHKPVAHIEPKDVVRMMELIQGRGATDIAKRVRNTCSQIFRYAITRGMCARNPAGDFKPSDVLPQRTAGNHARIEESELPDLLRKIEAYAGMPHTRLAMKLLAMTFVRTSELIEAKWSEIDFDTAEWRIPAERMKMKRMHIVPLAPQAIEVLRTLQVISGKSELLFPGERDRKKPMSNNTILKALERMGYKGRMTGHGFRGLASTALHERQFPSDHIELQLAHVRGKVRGAYDHSKQLPQRRKMMEHWANYLEDCLKPYISRRCSGPAV
jgi:integrase